MTDLHWIAAGDYQLALDGTTITAKNAKGRVLKTVPAKAKETPEYEQLNNCRIYLEQHQKECLRQVSEWFLKGLPVPVLVVSEVWPDPLWRACFENLVVCVTATGDTGLLRDVSDGHLHLADLDGEEITVPVDESGSITIPHPAIIADIADWREFAAELGVSQGVDQLFRDIYVKPDDAVGRQRAVRAYTDGRYEKAQVLIGRSRGGGFTTTMQEVSLIVVEDGVEVRISLDIDAWDPWEGGTIGELSFYHDGQSLPLEKVGPITWSEGIRMAEFVYAGRTVESAEELS